MYKIKIEAYKHYGRNIETSEEILKKAPLIGSTGLIEDEMVYLFEGINIRYSIKPIKSREEYNSIMKHLEEHENTEVTIIGEVFSSNFFCEVGKEPNELPIVTMRFNSPENNNYRCLLVAHSNIYIMSEKGDTIDLLRL